LERVTLKNIELEILRAKNAQEYRNRKFLERVTLKNIEIESS